MNRADGTVATSVAPVGPTWLAMLRASPSFHGVVWPSAPFVFYAFICFLSGKPLYSIVLVPFLTPFLVWRIAQIQRSLRCLCVPNVEVAANGALAALVLGALALGLNDAIRLSQPLTEHALRAVYLFSFGAIVALVQIRMVWVIFVAGIALGYVDRDAASLNGLGALAQWLKHAFWQSGPLGARIFGTAVLAGGAFWLWREYGRLEANGGAAVRMPLFWMFDARNPAQDIEILTSGSESSGARSAYGPDRPLRALRTWIGGAFVPAPMKQAIEIVLLAASGVAVVLFVRGLPTLLAEPISVCLSLLTAVTLAIGISLRLGRLLRLMRGDAGERAELALLPGWGGAERARGLLLRATLAHLAGHAALMSLPVGLCVYLIADVFGLGQAFYAATAMGYTMIVALTMLSALAILAGGAFTAIPAPAFVMLIVFLTFQIVTLLLAAMRSTVSGWILAAAIAGLIALAVVLLWRTIRSRPHPFLPG